MSDITLFRDGAEVDSQDYSVSDASDGSFTVNIGKLDAVPYQLTYTTTLSPEEEIGTVENLATITYTDGEESAHKNVPSPTLEVSKEATNLDKEPENPVISWQINANTDSENHYVNLVDPVLTDTIPEDQALVQGSIEVTREDGTEITISEEDITSDSNSFSIILPDGPYQYVVTFDTEILEYPSFHESDLDRYTNSTTLTTANHSDATANAYQDYFEGEDEGLVGKNGAQNPDTENIDWTVTVNEEGLTINNPEITDSLSDNQAYLTDTIKVMDSEGNELAADSYELVPGDDNRSFTLTFANNVITEPVILSYSTRLNPDLIGTYDVSNSITLRGGQDEREIYTETDTTTASQWFYGGGGSGRTLQFEMNKETPNGTPLEDVKFTLEREDFSGNIVGVEAEVITNENGVFISGDNLRAGRYILTEVEESTPEGYQTLQEPIYFVASYARPEEEGDYTVTLTNSEWTTSEHENATASGNVITIVNDYEPVAVEFVANKSLSGQDLTAGQFDFELVNNEGTVIATATNDEEGNVTFEEQSFNSLGTYNFQIREVDSGLGGVDYDDSVYNVQVIVAEGASGLETDVNYLDGDANFENTYAADPTSANMEARKELSGQEIREGQFDFELVNEADEVIQTVSNNADGSINFDPIEYTEAGDYTYIIREVEGDNAGITYDDSTFEVTVSVTDDGAGQLLATVIYPNDETPVFTNSYAAEPGSIVLEAQKVLEGRDLLADEFEFQLVGQDDDVNETVSNDADGNIVFSEISYDTPGEYNYTIQEVAGELGGVEYDPSTQNVTVNVTDNNEGQLVAEATYENGESVFTNTYTTTPTEATITGEKILDGQDLEAGQFSFELLNEQGHTIQTVENAADGTIAFNPITYTEPGDYNYTVREVEGNQGGITYSDAEFAVTVSVEDNGEGALVATVDYTEGPVSFTNNYEAAPDSVVLEAEKILEGQALRDEQFNFELVDEADEVIQTTTNNANGQVIFDEISYDTVGTYTYTIREVNEELGGVTHDPAVYGVTVEVVDDGEGQLVATESYTDGPAVFTNIYEAAPDSIVLEASKILEGQELLNDQFTFELVDESGEVIQTTTNNANGQIIFDEITYSETGNHTYIIREVEGVQGGMTYDESQYVVVVSVEDDGQGSLVADANYIGGTPVFTNTYETTPDSAVIEASKVLEGQELRNGQFEFELVDDEGNVLQTKENNAEGQVIFDEITYDEAGEYNYAVREVEGTQGGVTYDDAVYNILVSVTDDREGTLTAEVQYIDGPAAFNNIYVPAPDSVVFEASKILEGQDLRNGQFEFELVNEAGDVIETVSNNANGQVIFSEMSFDTVGTYDYTIREVEGTQGGMAYDDTEFGVTVEVTDDGEGQLHATETYSAEDVQFTNTYTPAPDSVVLEATKALEGQDLRNDQFEFELVNADGEVIQTVSNNANGQVIFDEITYDTADEYNYTIREVIGNQGGVTYDNTTFDVLVTVTDDDEGQLHATAEVVDGPAEFTNIYSPDAAIVQFEAEKHLEGKDLTAEQFAFEVVDREGNVVVTGTNDVAGNISFEAMEFTEIGTYEYTIREVAGDDVNINYDEAEFGAVVEVTDDDEGQLHASVDYPEGTPVFENSFKKVSVGDYVWIDENKDGLQDETDIPLENVVLILKDEDGNIVTEDVYGNPIEPQVTDENGFYTFDDLPINHTYTVEIDREASEEALRGLTPTIETEDNRENDSSTWRAESVYLDEDGQRDPTLDFGFVRTPKVSVGDYVWFDENNDGLQDETDIPLEDIVLTIEDEDGNPVTDVYGDPVGPTRTDENGWYTFDNLPIDNVYIVRIDREAFEDTYPELVPTIDKTGDDSAIDSSTWVATSIFLDEDGQRDPTLDFGFVLETPDPGDPEDPEDPEKPGEPGDPGDPKDPSDPEDPKDPEDPSEAEDSDLPTTGEAVTYTALGVALLVLGGALVLYDRKWSSKSNK